MRQHGVRNVIPLHSHVAVKASANHPTMHRRLYDHAADHVDDAVVLTRADADRLAAIIDLARLRRLTQREVAEAVGLLADTTGDAS